MNRTLAFAVLVAACGSSAQTAPVRSTPDGAADDAAPTSRGPANGATAPGVANAGETGNAGEGEQELGSAAPAHPQPAPAPLPDAEQTDTDIRAILAADVSAPTTRRLLATPEAVVARLLSHHAQRDANSNMSFASDARPDRLLAFLYAPATDAVRNASSRLWHSAMTLQSRNGSATATQQRVARNLDILASGVDLAIQPSWERVDAVNVCVADVPTFGPVVRVVRDCTCGQVHACVARVSGEFVDLDVQMDPDSDAICHDCYPSTAACRMPALSPGRTFTLRSAGRTFGTVRVDSRGRPSETCEP